MEPYRPFGNAGLTGDGKRAEDSTRMATPAPPSSASFTDTIHAIAPGLALALAIAFASVALRDASGIAALNPVVVALLAGILLRRAIGAPARLRPGIGFAVRPLLRAAIVLLGLQLTVWQLAAVGPGVIALAVVVVAVTLPATALMGRALGVPANLSLLIGTGTAICGASAIVAANQVLRGRQEDVTYALGVITLCGTAALLVYPALAGPLGLDPRAFGIWAGASIHEVVQAVGAAAAGGPVATETGTVTKLARVLLLAPAILALGAWAGRADGDAKVAVPWFAFGFLAMVGITSTGLLPGWIPATSRFVVPLMLAASVAALGLNTDISAIRARGLAPLLLGVASTLLIAALGLAGAWLV